MQVNVAGPLQWIGNALCALLVFCILCSPAHGRDALPIAVLEGDFESYQKLLAEFGPDPHKVERIPSGRFDRATIDILILVKALKLGGVTDDIQFRLVGNVRRQAEEVFTGMAVVGAHLLGMDTLAVRGYEDGLFVSSPVIRQGEFEKGIYCLPDNQRVLRVTSRQGLSRAGTAVIGLHWRSDIKALEAMGVIDVERCPVFESMIKMLAAGRVDWIPLEFSGTDDLSKTMYGVRLIPVPGIKFLLPESRHFIVSKGHPLGPRVLRGLNEGIQQLHQQGFIREALTSAGFFNTKTASWTVLNDGLIGEE